MKYVLSVITSFAFFAVPALAQPSGVPAPGGVAAQINSLQAQIDALTAGDGTAEAIVGTWTGSVNSLVFEQSMTQSSPTSEPTHVPFFHVYGKVEGGMFGGVFNAMQPNFTTQIMGLGTCVGPPAVTVGCFVPQGSFVVAVNPKMWVVSGDRTPITITLARNGMNLTGCSAAACPNPSVAGLRGVVVGNNFALLRVTVTELGPCGVSIYQGTAVLSLDRTRMTFTGSGVDAACTHQNFSVNLTKS